MKRLSLRPFNGNLYYCKTREDYEKTHWRIYRETDPLNAGQQGRFCGKPDKDGMWTYIIWAETAPNLAHELSHVVMHVFDRCGIDPRHDCGEVFCYMLSQLMLDAQA